MNTIAVINGQKRLIATSGVENLIVWTPVMPCWFAPGQGPGS